ncbi:hypothetical protein D3C87_1457370 [compost metagenome]
MGYRFLAALFLVFGVQAHATSCLLSDALKDPALSGNEKFWAEYGKLSPKDQHSDVALKALIEKYQGVGAGATQTASTVNSAGSGALKLTIQHKAEKEIKHLQKHLKEKVDEFLEIALKPGGMQEIRNNPGRWHYERLSQFGDHAHSIRLNNGYRILFDLNGDTIEVRRVNAAQIHGN